MGSCASKINEIPGGELNNAGGGSGKSDSAEDLIKASNEPNEDTTVAMFHATLTHHFNTTQDMCTQYSGDDGDAIHVSHTGPPAIVPHQLIMTYTLGDVLGEGAFSVVKLAVNRKTGRKVAVKCIDRQGLPEEDTNSLRQEVAIMKSLKHKNIVEFIDFFEEEKFFYVVLEFLEGGELFDRIVKKNFYNEKEARDVVSEILSGMKYCHDKGIAHRDMKPENLLLMSKEDDSFVKIADFGSAVHGAQPGHRASQCGTPAFEAPEILQNEPFDKSVDMWSIGVITYILLGGYPPFEDESEYKLFRKITKGKFEFHDTYWGGVSNEAKDFISQLLKVEPKHRMSCDQAFEHPWLKCDADELAGHDLNDNLAALKKYHSSSKFRSVGIAIRALSRLGANTSSFNELPQ